MPDSEKTQINIRFENMGTVAPEKTPGNEIWLDVGNRSTPPVIDHHGGDTSALCAAELVLKYKDALKQIAAASASEITFVLHSAPDLDAICSAWIAERIINSDRFLEEQGVNLETIVREVGYNDQGYTKTSELEQSLPIVFRILMQTEYYGLNDEQKVMKGFGILDTTLELMAGSTPMKEAVAQLLSPRARMHISQARRDYREDLSRGMIFQIKLPVISSKNTFRLDCTGTGNGSPGDARWSAADALYVENPRCIILKEIARADHENSPRGEGFQLLVVAHSTGICFNDVPYKRYIISTDPLSGLSVEGLGPMLEKAEEEKEEKDGGELPSGRQRTKPGKGRHGYDVQSPWYDGRAHDFTIVDCPSIEIGNNKIVASRLTTKELLQTLWEYGNPAARVEVKEAELAIAFPVTLRKNWESEWPETNKLPAGSETELCEEVIESLNLGDEGVGLEIRGRTVVKGEVFCGFEICRQQLWRFPEGSCLWLVTMRVPVEQNISVAGLCDMLAEAKKVNIATIAPSGMDLLKKVDSYRIVHARLDYFQATLDTNDNFNARIFHQLAISSAPDFFDTPSDGDLSNRETVMSGDRRMLLYATQHGAAVISSRKSAFMFEDSFDNPELFRTLMMIALANRVALRNIALDFSVHRNTIASHDSQQTIINDKWRILLIDQLLSFQRVAESSYGNRSYNAISRVLNTQEIMHDTKRKIETLSGQISESRAEFYQKLSSWISVIFAPLALTAAFFSGIQMDRDFADKYYQFLPAHLEPSGWMTFLVIFLIISAATGITWRLIMSGYRSADIINLFKSPNKNKNKS